MPFYRLEYEYYNEIDRTTSDGFSGGPIGWSRLCVTFRLNSDKEARSEVKKRLKNSSYKTRYPLLLKLVDL